MTTRVLKKWMVSKEEGTIRRMGLLRDEVELLGRRLLQWTKQRGRREN